MNLIKLLILSTITISLIACKGAPTPDDTSNEVEEIQETTDEQTNEQEEPIEEEEVDLSSGECPYSGAIAYTLNNPDSWPAEARTRIDEAMSEAVWYYNCYADLSHNITVNYNTGVPTAEANVDGWMTFGGNAYYQHVITAMHEIGHTMGVGYYPWTELTDGNRRWIGEEVKKFVESIPEDQRANGAGNYITADSTHFWPYGLNQRTEAEDNRGNIHEWSLINHVRIVAAMQVDKQTFLRR